MIAKIISDKVPFIGGLINRMVKRILTLVSDKVKFHEESLKQELSKKESEPNILQIYTRAISSVSLGLEKVMNFTFRVTQFPLLMVFGIIFLILISFLYIIH